MDTSLTRDEELFLEELEKNTPILGSLPQVEVSGKRAGRVIVDKSQKPETPFSLVEKMFEQLGEWNPDWTVLVVGDLTFFEVALLKAGPGKVSFVVCDSTARGATHRKHVEEAGIVAFEWNEKVLKDMQFDIVIGNPPYGQGTAASKRLWEEFVELSFKNAKPKGIVSLITPSGWIGSTSASGCVLKYKKMLYANFNSSVSEAFNGTGGSARFTYWIAQNVNAKFDQTFPIEFDDGQYDLHPFSCKIVPVKSSVGKDFAILEKLLNSTFKPVAWKRKDVPADKQRGYEVVVERAKSPGRKIEAQPYGTTPGYIHGPCSKDEAEIIAHNLNLKLYVRMRWVLRPGMALVSTFCDLPIPTHKKLDDHELHDAIGMTDDEADYIISTR